MMVLSSIKSKTFSNDEEKRVKVINSGSENNKMQILRKLTNLNDVDNLYYEWRKKNNITTISFDESGGLLELLSLPEKSFFLCKEM